MINIFHGVEFNTEADKEIAIKRLSIVWNALDTASKLLRQFQTGAQQGDVAITCHKLGNDLMKVKMVAGNYENKEASDMV